MNSDLRIFITAGEASGDVLGARLMAALKDAHGGVTFSGVGGEQMRAQGLSSLFPMEDLSVMGIAEVLPRLPKILKRIKETAQRIIEEKPDIVVTIDSPDFSFRVAKVVRAQSGREIKMVHYVAPTVWAWRPERAAKVAGLYDGVICLFPFEPPYFEKEGMRACFAGHAVLENGFGRGNASIFRKQQGIAEDAKVLGVLFGSRRGELKRVGPILRRVIMEQARQHPDMELVAPTLPHLADKVADLLRDIPCSIHIPVDPEIKQDVFAAMNRALAVSGTVGLELAMAGVPHIIGYRTNPLTWEIARRKLTIKYAHLVNILLDSPVVPEFIQKDCTAGKLEAALERLWRSADLQKEAFEKARALLSGAGQGSPSEQAAAFVLDMA